MRYDNINLVADELHERGRGGTADALDSGSSEGNFVEVQVLSTAPSLPGDNQKIC